MRCLESISKGSGEVYSSGRFNIVRGSPNCNPLNTCPYDLWINSGKGLYNVLSMRCRR